MADIGGQAVIEGVLMKAPDKISIAVRLEDGKIKKRITDWIAFSKRNRFLGLPLVRGVATMAEMLFIGMESLTWSANQQAGEGEELSNKEMILTIMFALGLTVLIFIIAPFFLARFLAHDKGDLVFNLLDGVIRLLFFFAYLLIIAQMNDIRRLFEYHGAEHKAVHCFEAGKPLTVKNVQKYPTEHSRCGTSFLILVVGISIVVFSLIIDPRWYVKLLSRILLIPIIAGISYELLKLSSKFHDHPLMSIVVYPGILLQKITTRQPDDRQVEVAIAALKAVKPSKASYARPAKPL
ncbi:MAG: DUF1385 domain-containing protein [Nanoarchaeota archaeon]|mgnify:CR=1 FL=1